MINPAVRWAFYLFAFSIPIEYPTTLPTQIHTVTAVVFLGAALLQPAVSYRRPTAAVWWLAAYLWIYLALAISSEHPVDSLRLFANSLIAGLVLWVCSNLMRDRTTARGALVSFVLGCTTIAALALAGIGLSPVEVHDRVRSAMFAQDPNFTGGNMALALAAMLGLVAAVRSVTAMAAVGIAGVLLTGSFLAAGSRGAFVAMAVGLLAFAFGGSAPRGAAHRTALALAAAAILVWEGWGVEPVRERVTTTLADGNLSGRERIYSEAWHMILDRPVLGWGPADARYELRLRTAAWEPGQVRKSPLERDAHNLVLESLIASGLAGTIPLLVCIVLCIRASWQARAGPHGGASFVLIATVLALSMSSNWSMSKEAWLSFAYGLAANTRGEP